MRKQRRRSQEFKRADGAAPRDSVAAAVSPRSYAGAWLPMLSAILLTLAFAPISQFYLAWIGLLPWLLFIRRAASQRRLFFWNWTAGTTFSALNIWWLGFVTVPGTIGSVLYMGLYWGVAASVVRATGWALASSGLRGIRAVFGIAAIWTGCEWVRGNLGTGWPWSFLGYTQTPILPMCQIADLLGVYGVTFWLVAVNVALATLVFEHLRVRTVQAPLSSAAAMLAVITGYGIVRIAQTRTTPGPRVMVVQSNFPQSNTGDKGATREELVAFHVNTTRTALAAERDAGRRVDLVAWSETMMPALNRAARDYTHGSPLGHFLDDTYHQLASLCFDSRTALITGGAYAGKMMIRDEMYIDLDRRNAAYFFEPTGMMSDLRYDKVHLVPFGEYVPFKETIPPLYRFFMWFSPYDFDYNLVPGTDDSLTVFTIGAYSLAPVHRGEGGGEGRAALSLPTTSNSPTSLPLSPPLSPVYVGEGASEARFVAPICFEDADPRLLARMFRPDKKRPGKRADFIVNITNDGWFSQPQLSQHLQIARFRSIENRVPTARSVNTGVSAFIDSVGCVTERLPAQVEGTLGRELALDARVSMYTRFGDVFAALCAAITALAALWTFVQHRRKPRAVPSTD